MSHALAAPPPRPGRVQPLCAPLPLPHPLRLPGGTVERSSSLGHTQPKGCQLLFAVHFAPFCCSSAAPFIIHRSSYCGARYNAQLQHRRRAEYAGPALFRIALHCYADVTNGTEGESACSRLLVLARSPRSLVRRAPACVHARVRVSVHRVYARQNTK